MLMGALAAIGAVAVTGLAFAACAFSMPGRSFEGAAPPLSADQRALADRLRAHVVELAGEIGERNLDHYDGLERARHYIHAQLAAVGYSTADLPFTYRHATFYNVEALSPEADSAAAGVVVGAHYDSVEGSPGANDNASGVAALIEVARLLRQAPPPAPLRFVAFANEEPPYFNTGQGMGSVAYVDRFTDPAASLRFMLSLESVGIYRDEPGSQQYPLGVGLFYPERGNFVAFIANPASRSLLRDLLRHFRASATLPSEGAALPDWVPGVAWSDHRSFWQAGVPALMVTDTAPFRDPAYHRPTDTPERLDYERMARLVTALAPAIAATAAGR